MDANDSTNAGLKGDDIHDIPDAGVAVIPLVDTDGNPVRSHLFYKLLMSDGTELGMTRSQFDWLADESPSNGGAIIQFSKTSPDPGPLETWNDGDSAFVRGASYEDGKLVKLYLYVFHPINAPFHVGWTPNIAQATTKFRAVHVAGTRVSWHAVLSPTAPGFGIRLNTSNATLEVDTSALRLPLACQFELVEPLPADITVP